MISIMSEERPEVAVEPPHLIYWTDIEALPPLPGFLRKAVSGERAMLMRVAIEAGRELPAHSHENEQFTIMLEGQLAFTIEDGTGRSEFVATAGSIVHVPGGVTHSARAIDDVLSIDVFSPPRPELLPQARP